MIPMINEMIAIILELVSRATLRQQNPLSKRPAPIVINMQPNTKLYKVGSDGSLRGK